MADVTLSVLGDYIGSAYSPTVEVEEVAGGHSVTITHKEQSGMVTQTFDVLDGATGPQGPRGPQGVQGETGEAAGFGTPTATVDSTIGTPSVSVSASGPDTAKAFAFAFSGIKGEKGETGDPAAVGSIGTEQLADGAVTRYKIAQGAVGPDEIGAALSYNVVDGDLQITFV